MPSNPPPTLGVNNKVLIYEPNSPWKIWAYQEIYIGTTESGVYVPKVNDFVLNYEDFIWYKVISLDSTSFIPTLDTVQFIPSGEEFSDYDVILGQGPGSVYDTYRAYLDTSVMPYSLALEQRNYIHGTMAQYVKIFRGSIANANDYRVISMFYDTNGNFLGDQVPLELVYMPNGQNYATYSIPPCKTSEDMPDGEIITVVVYSDTGHVVSKCKFIVERTSYIRSVNESIKYVSSISLESDFISGSNPSLINFPINVPLNSLNLIGVVHYSDGSTTRMPVDNTRFKVFGLESFVSTIVGQEIPIVLTYTLGNSEVAYGTSVGETHHISESYVAKTVEADGQYAVKLYCYPVWQDSVNGYKLRWFMYNLDRELVFEVTPSIIFNSTSQTYNPTMYGVTQTLSVSINLQNVSGTFANYIHTQTIGVSLLKPGNDTPTNWTILFESGQNPVYGLGNEAKLDFVNSNLSRLDIKCGATDLEDWLDKLYYPTKPLKNPSTEATPPVPNMFTVMVDGFEVTLPIVEWQNQITINGLVKNMDTAFIKFIFRTSTDDIQLSIAGIPIHQI